MSTSSQYYRVTARVGVPHRYEVEVTVPLVGPAGPAGAAGTSDYNELSNKPTIPAASTTTPAALGTAEVGTGTTFARADHVHAMPTAANVGATPAVAITSLSLANTTHTATAGRNQLILLTLTNSAGAIFVLPSTGNLEGDRLVILGVAHVGSGATIRTSGFVFFPFTTRVGRTSSFVYTSGDWIQIGTETHIHVATDVSGVALDTQISKTYAVFSATDNQPPATVFATLDTRNSIAVLDFDAAPPNESAVFVGIIPEAASLSSGLKIRLHWMATSATSGGVVWSVSLERMTTDLDSDSFDTIASGTATAQATSGILTVTEITLTTIDGVTAGDAFRLKVTRDADNGSDDMSGDAELVVCEVRSAA